jgi:glycosyltransferase involved in cell wall biosynthesis
MEFRNHVNLNHFPRLFLVVENMSKENILALHKRCDVFVLLQRSEGFGLPHFEAAACGKPVITPDYGGQTEFLNQDNSYPVNHTLTPVMGMNRFSTYYQSNQLWCEPDIKHAMDQMLHVYNNREEARAKGALARRFIEDNFTWDTIGKIAVDRLLEIDRGNK